MYSTALPLLFPEMLDEQSAFLRADGSLLSLYEAFAAVPGGRLALQLVGSRRTMVSRPPVAPTSPLWATRLLYPHRIALSSPLASLECGAHRTGAGCLGQCHSPPQ